MSPNLYPETSAGRARRTFCARNREKGAAMRDSLRAHRVVIGTVTVAEPFEVTALHQYAAHFTTHRVTPGTYDVVACSEYTDHVNGRATAVRPYYVAVEYDTTIVAESFDQERHCSRRGATATHRAERYAYECPGELADGEQSAEWFGGQFRIADGARFESTRSGGARPLVNITDA